MSRERIAMQAGGMYYVYTRANGLEELFQKEAEYFEFLRRYGTYLSPVVETFSYCLTPVRLEFCVRVRSLGELEAAFQLIRPQAVWDESRLSDWLMKQFSNLLNSYAKSYNHAYDRLGALFVDRVRIEFLHTNEELQKRVTGMHMRPVAEGNCERMIDWPWSSYTALLSDRPSWLAKELLWSLFDGRDCFNRIHKD